MPKLIVVPHDVADMMRAEGISFKILFDAEQMSHELSANDMADIHIATESFPFRFSEVLDIQCGLTPLQQLSIHDKLSDVYNRVKESVDTQALRSVDSDAFVSSYTLNTVDETMWVAVLQRQDRQAGDPGKQLLSSNHSFFDGLIAQVLHVFSFEKLCTTNLFTYFMGSLSPKTV